MIYTDSFKAKMVQRMSAPNAISALSLSKEVGVSQSQLSRWLRTAHTLGPMTKKRPSEPVAQSGSVRTAAEKLRMVMAAAALDPSELGAFLRREGVHEAYPHLLFMLLRPVGGADERGGHRGGQPGEDQPPGRRLVARPGVHEAGGQPGAHRDLYEHRVQRMP